jgi:hypothetical protein
VGDRGQDMHQQGGGGARLVRVQSLRNRNNRMPSDCSSWLPLTQ